MNNETLITRLKRAERYYVGEVSPLFREAAAEIERLELEIKDYKGLVVSSNDKYNEAADKIERLENKLLDAATKHSEAIQRNDELLKMYVARGEAIRKLIEENSRLQAELDNLALAAHSNKSFPEVNIKPEELRDQFAIAALEGCLSAKGWHPEYIIPAGGGHVGGQRAADAAAESAYKYADAMLKAREK